METQELMNEEVVEATEGTGCSKAVKGGVLAAITAGIITAGVLTYKKVVKPLVEKHKAKKANANKAEDPDAWKQELHEAATEEID